MQAGFLQIANLTVVVVGTEDTTDSLYSGLTVASSNHNVDTTGLYTVSGVVSNTGSQTSGQAGYRYLLQFNRIRSKY